MIMAKIIRGAKYNIYVAGVPQSAKMAKTTVYATKAATK
jgi:hypothetical protein